MTGRRLVLTIAAVAVFAAMAMVVLLNLLADEPTDPELARLGLFGGLACLAASFLP